MIRPPSLRAAAVAALALLPIACDVPEFQGPQIQRPPPAFTMNAATYQDRRMFPDRDIVFHEAWVEASWGNFSGIYLNGHAGALSRGDVEAARSDAIQGAAGRRAEFGEVETLTIDGREAWGWGESWRLDNGGLDFVVFRAVVPYDTISYAIDFLAGDPGLKARPDSLRTVVASFAIGRTTWNLPLVAIGSGALLLLLTTLRGRARARQEATRRMTLVKVPKKAAAEAATLSEATVAGQIARQLDAKRQGSQDPG